MLLGTTRYFEAEKEGGSGGKSPAEKERENIKVNDSTIVSEDKKEEKEKESEDKDNVDKENEGEKEEKDEEVEEGEDNKEDDKENEVKELSAEQKTIKKLEKTIERLQKRVGRTTGERDANKKELNEAKAALDAKLKDGEQPLTEEEVERRATAKANQTIAEKEFDNAQKKLIADAKKIDPDFMRKVNEMAEDVSPIPPFMIGALEDIENGGAVLSYLTNNVDEYEELFGLNPAKMVNKLNKISEKLLEEAKPKKKAISKVPKPNETIGGGTKSPTVLSDNMPMDEWVRKRNEDAANHRKAKMR